MLIQSDVVSILEKLKKGFRWLNFDSKKFRRGTQKCEIR